MPNATMKSLPCDLPQSKERLSDLNNEEGKAYTASSPYSDLAAWDTKVLNDMSGKCKPVEPSGLPGLQLDANYMTPVVHQGPSQCMSQCHRGQKPQTNAVPSTKMQHVPGDPPQGNQLNFRL